MDGEAGRSGSACLLLLRLLTGASAFIAAAMIIAAGACSTPREEARRATRPEGRSCGSYVVPQGHFDAADVRTQQECLADAFATGDRRTLTYRQPTEEGDPIEVSLTVVGEGVVDVRTDATEDGYGGVRMERCRQLALVRGHLEASDCVAAPGPGS